MTFESPFPFHARIRISCNVDMTRLRHFNGIPWLVVLLCWRPLLPAQELGPAPFGTEADFVKVPAAVRKLVVTVVPTNRADVVRLYQTTYRESQVVHSGWTGNRETCDPGLVRQEYLDATILRVNYYRAMAGLPGDVTLSNAWNVKAQQAALMFSVNGELDHFPPASWACYTPGGAEAAGKSNISLGADAAAAIDLYMDDSGSGNSAVGHRRWILYPPARLMGAGNIPRTGGQAANDLWVIGGAGPRPARPEWVAWPAPGYIPYQVMPRSSRRWSFSCPNADFSNTRIYMQCSGTNVPVTLENLWPGYGDNTIVWRPTGVPTSAPREDLTYTVSVSNVVVGTQSRVFNYTSTIIDPAVPALSLVRISPDTIELSWAAASGGYVLQRSDAPGDASGWLPANLPIQTVGERYVAVATVSSDAQFFRLSRE